MLHTFKILNCLRSTHFTPAAVDTLYTQPVIAHVRSEPPRRTQHVYKKRLTTSFPAALCSFDPTYVLYQLAGGQTLHTISYRAFVLRTSSQWVNHFQHVYKKRLTISFTAALCSFVPMLSKHAPWLLLINRYIHTKMHTVYQLAGGHTLHTTSYRAFVLRTPQHVYKKRLTTSFTAALPVNWLRPNWGWIKFVLLLWRGRQLHGL